MRFFVVVLALLLTACTGGSNRTSPQPSAAPTSTPADPAAALSARVVLPSKTVIAGSSIVGEIIVENDSGSAVRGFGCESAFQVLLSNDEYQPAANWLGCRQLITIPVGESRYPFTVFARYNISTGGTPLAPLPAGDYEAKLYQSPDLVPTPPPITIHVTP